MEAVEVVLFIRRVNRVIFLCKPHQHRFHAQDGFEIAPRSGSSRRTPTKAAGLGHSALSAVAGRLEGRVVGRHGRGGRGAVPREFGPCSQPGPARLHEVAKRAPAACAGPARPTSRKLTLALACAGKHGLEPGARVAGDHAVDLAGRARPDHLQRGAVLLARWHAQARRLPEERSRCRNPNPAHCARISARQVRHVVVEARQGHAPRDRRADRPGCAPAPAPGSWPPRRTCLNAESRSAAWIVTSSPSSPRSMVVMAGVPAVDTVAVSHISATSAFSAAACSCHVRHQRGRAAFLFAFQQECQLHRQTGHAPPSRRGRPP